MFILADALDLRRLIAQYRELGVHRLVISAPSLAPAKAEAELEALAKAWIV